MGTPEPSNKEYITTWSGRKLSDSGTRKRRRQEDAAEDNCSSRPKMSKTPADDSAVGFTYKQFTDALSKELEINRNKISKDTESSIAKLTDGLERTREDFNNHKKEIDEQLSRMNARIDACIKEPVTNVRGASGGGSSYAAAAAAAAASTPRSEAGRGAAELRQYYRFFSNYWPTYFLF